VMEVLKLYCDGFHYGDVEKLRQAFHPNCHLYSAPEGELVDHDMPTVFARVEGRENPADRGDPRHDNIISIDFSSPTSAFVKLQISVSPNLFTDYLTLLKVNGTWRIVTKTFTAEPLHG